MYVWENLRRTLAWEGERGRKRRGEGEGKEEGEGEGEGDLLVHQQSVEM